MDDTSNTEPAPAAPATRTWRSGVVAVGAALGMTLAGLGIANAQTDNTAPPSTEAPAPDREDRPGPRFGRHCHLRHHALEAAAEAIGISEADLVSELRDGKSIAQVAESKNVPVQKVIDAMVADAKAHLAEKVASGDLTQQEADAKLARLTERVTEVVNREGLPQRRGPGRRGFDGPPDGEAEQTTLLFEEV